MFIYVYLTKVSQLNHFKNRLIKSKIGTLGIWIGLFDGIILL
jgi:hypothetical protein